jgi:rhodanese-related sulfurtransferase
MHTALGRVLAIGLVSVTLAACGGGRQDFGESFQQVARTIIHGGDQVSAETLADWLIKGRQDFVLIDVRSQKAYENGHIESAMSLPLTYLLEPGVLSDLPSDRLIVLYANGIREAAQAAVMLRLAGIQASTLLGGYNAWEQHVLHPELTATTDAEVLEAKKRQAIACYFAGNYKSGTGRDEPQPAAFTPSVVSAPALPSAGATPTGKGEAVIVEGC